MNRIHALLILVLFLWSCEGAKSPEKNKSDNREKVKKDGFLSDEEIKRFIEGQLKILGTEDYTLQVYEEQLNADDVPDKIITVNLLDRAYKDAVQNDKVAVMEATGYNGNYNYFFYLDGASQVITSPIVVASSPKTPLKVTFDHITSEAFNDIQIDLRIQNSCFRRFYTIYEKVPMQTSETEVFLDLGSPNAKAFAVVLEPGTHSVAKNIAIYEGVLPNLTKEELVNLHQTDPEIKPTKTLVRRWYYSPQHMKYYLKKSEI